MSGLSTTCAFPPQPAPARRLFHGHQVSPCECCSEDTPALHFRRCPRCGRAFEPRRRYRRTRGQSPWSRLRDLLSLPGVTIDNVSKLAWIIGDAALVIALVAAAMGRLLGP